MTTKVLTSKHAKNRIKERCGVGKGTADRISSMAYERGISTEHTKGALRKWLEGKNVTGKDQIKVWGDKAYIYSEKNVLITVLQLPAAITRNKSRMIVTAI